MLVEIHALQSFAPSNLNRDDTGNPKDTVFGGTRRLRISSQAQKRPIRLSPHFREEVGKAAGVRTKRLVEELTRALMEGGVPNEQAGKFAAAFVKKIAGLNEDNNQSAVLVYISPDEFKSIAGQLAEAARQTAEGADVPDKIIKDTIKLLERDKSRLTAPDLALFGRMLANSPELNVDAAAQVAHAISTHSSSIEFDYFTAVDDLAPREQTGAGMIGTVAFGSATYYRYARVDVSLLERNLGTDAALAQATVMGFMRAFLYALPTGKQNTFAAHNLPEFVIGIVRPDHQGWSLANAFEVPVRSKHNEGYLAPSIQALVQHWLKMERAYQLVAPKATVILNVGDHAAPLPEDTPVSLTSSVMEFLTMMRAALQSEA
ncbi:type I-E CRISPR-associated protein Cas7/Cse4/CasC [Aggregatilineales bacterium SYSU G02658]